VNKLKNTAATAQKLWGKMGRYYMLGNESECSTKCPAPLRSFDILAPYKLAYYYYYYYKVKKG